MVSKSPWLPAIRREHALATCAVSAGVPVDFVEQPGDVRTLRDDRAGYLGRLRRPSGSTTPEGVRVWARSTVLPPHRSRLALELDGRLLRRAVSRVPGSAGGTVVAMTPWSWPALSRLDRSTTRAVDLADDWTLLMKGREAMIRRLYERIAGEADVIVVASRDLVGHFAGRDVHVVPNATDDEMLARPPTVRPRTRSLVAVGTLSERFDVDMVRALLVELPDWSLRLYGQCRYAGMGDRPSPELADLLRDHARQVSWEGVVPRARLRETLDSADALLVAHRPSFTTGQDSMKLYDYATSGRPVVCARGSFEQDASTAPGTYVGGDAATLAAQVRDSEHEPDDLAHARVRWGGQNVWSIRWGQWWSAVNAVQPTPSTERVP